VKEVLLLLVIWMEMLRLLRRQAGGWPNTMASGMLC
jgi:hypothetical protein